jgi:hypothetical protein
VGARARSTRFTALLFDPPTLPTDLGLALVTGSSAATTHPRSRHHPSPWPMARVPQAMEQVISHSDLSLSLSLSLSVSLSISEIGHIQYRDRSTDIVLA